ncbi:MAG: histidine phosphatase family protein [Patescibacteria group bacterium]
MNDRQSFSPEAELNPEKGKNVRIVIKFIRHGERSEDGQLLDSGREDTLELAKSVDKEQFDAVKAIGSNYGPASEVEVKGEARKMGRALETAHLFASGVDEDAEFTSRANEILDPNNLHTPMPYNHKAMVKSFLPENYDDLPEEEKNKLYKEAHQKTLDYALDLYSPEAIAWKMERAGAFANIIEHYQKMAARLKNGSKVLLPAGAHSPYMEIILQFALVRETEVGQDWQISPEEIGGAFQPSEAYNVEIETDDAGALKDIGISFDNPDRPQGNLKLDADVIKDLSAHYQDLHPVDKYESDLSNE